MPKSQNAKLSTSKVNIPITGMAADSTMSGLAVAMNDVRLRPSVHVEVCRKWSSSAKSETIEEHVICLLKESKHIYDGLCITDFGTDPFLRDNIERVQVGELDGNDSQVFLISEVGLHIHIFQLNQDGPAIEQLDDEGSGDGSSLPAATHWLVPSLEFHGLWESLVFDSEVKTRLLDYVSTTLLFSDRDIDTTIVSWNRVILLHGPPGTGKTSLCKALAHKLAIRYSHRYAYGQLVEINSHSLFSKWFSESGKLVMKMFQKIQELIADPNSLVCVLIDEVESLTAARKAAISGTEPSDAIRVVNAVLTQIDQIKSYPNVIILTTSNVTEGIDLAFVDRADIKQYIGLPSPAAIYKIYESCLRELMRKQVIYPREEIVALKTLQSLSFRENIASGGSLTTVAERSLQLRDIACASEGLSGRTLRKLPFLAHACFVKSSSCTLTDFMDALQLAIHRQFKERSDLTADS